MRTIGRIYAQTINNVVNVDAWINILGYLEMDDIVNVGYSNKTWMTVVETDRRQKFKYRRELERKLRDVEWKYDYSIANSGRSQSSQITYSIKMSKSIVGLSYVKEIDLVIPNDSYLNSLDAATSYKYTELRNDKEIFSINTLEQGTNIQKLISNDTYEYKRYEDKHLTYENKIYFDFGDENTNQMVSDFYPLTKLEARWIYKKTQDKRITIECDNYSNGKLSNELRPYSIIRYKANRVSVDVKWSKVFDPTLNKTIYHRVEKQYDNNSVLGYHMLKEQVIKYDSDIRPENFKYLDKGYIYPELFTYNDNVSIISIDEKEYTMNNIIKKHKQSIFDNGKETKTTTKRKDILRYKDWRIFALTYNMKRMNIYFNSKQRRHELIQIAEVNNDKMLEYEKNSEHYDTLYDKQVYEKKQEQIRNKEYNKYVERLKAIRKDEREEKRKQKEAIREMKEEKRSQKSKAKIITVDEEDDE
jgi:hypothetical protein